MKVLKVMYFLFDLLWSKVIINTGLFTKLNYFTVSIKHGADVLVAVVTLSEVNHEKVESLEVYQL